MEQPELKKSVCEICLANCGVDAYVQDGRVVRVEGSRECQNRGRLCVKGYASREYIYREDRIRTPLRRVGARGEGKFEPISWEEAYREIAAHLNRYKAEYGADSVAFYAGYSKWYRTMFHRFAHSFGTLNYGTESSSCFQAMRMANILCGGTMARADIANTDLFIGWGYNPFYSGVFTFDQIDALREKGAKLLIVDPKLTPTAQLADLHLQIRAGTDGALALFFGNYLIAHDAIDHDYIARHVHGFAEYAEYVRQFPVERAAEITGERAEKLNRAAQMLVDCPRFCSQVGSAPLTHHRNGVQNIRAVLALSSITGNYDRAGGNIPTEFSDPHINADCHVGDAEFIARTRPADAKPKIGSARFPVWSELIGEFQAMDLSRQILEGTPYPIKAVFALGMNARMFPGNDRLFQALEQIDFFADVDIFMNRTAAYADIVLPACTSFERSQFQSAFVGAYMNPMTVRYLSPAIQPLYESKSDADILCELSAYLDMDDPVLTAGYDACASFMLRKVGVTLAELKSTSRATRIPGKEPYFPGDNTAYGYRTPTGKFELTSEVLRRHGYDALPTYTPGEDDVPDYPFLLIAGGRLPFHFHSRFQNSGLKDIFRPESMADINPGDAQRLDLRQGSAVTIETPYHSICLKANLTYAVAEGSVFVYQDYPDADVNSIIAPDQLDPISGFPAYRSIRCRVSRAAGKERAQ
ncbi:MAG: molybdopterin-dependent oxidoreductase [Oscillospiraceae bacterium]|nr:molybdopterin-dependent oxidoreductase [Oscillospiraceae bacterium]